MEYCAGVNLLDFTINKPEKSLTEAEASRIIKQVLLALHHAHSKKICHRDISPSNIMVAPDENQTIKLIDWGFSAE